MRRAGFDRAVGSRGTWQECVQAARKPNFVLGDHSSTLVVTAEL